MYVSPRSGRDLFGVCLGFWESISAMKLSSQVRQHPCVIALLPFRSWKRVHWLLLLSFQHRRHVLLCSQSILPINWSSALRSVVRRLSQGLGSLGIALRAYV